MAYSGSIRSVLGTVHVLSDGDMITGILISDDPPTDTIPRETDLISEAKAQLEEYLCGRRMTFDFPYGQKGTPFQESVWEALSDIGYGKTLTYGEIAESIPGGGHRVRDEQSPDRRTLPQGGLLLRDRRLLLRHRC